MNRSRTIRLATAIFAVLALGTAGAQDFERIAPKPVPAPDRPADLATPDTGDPDGPAASGETLLDSLRGIVLVPSQDALSDSPPAGIGFLGVDPPAADALRASLDGKLGKPFSLATLAGIQREVVAHYRANDRPFVDVLAPPQDITAGVVQLVVVEGRVGAVRAEGNEHFSSALLESKVRTAPGEPLSYRALRADLDALNRNPFRSVDLIYTPGGEFGQTDLVLETQDRRPFRIYGGYEDTGLEIYGRERWFTGFNWGNVFGLDHQLGYQFTTAGDFDELRAHSLTYLAPLPWRHHTLSAYFGYAKAENVLDMGAGARFDSDGESVQTGFRYEVPLPQVANITHSVSGGFDYKHTTDDLLFGRASVFDSDTEIFQFSAAYRGSRPDPGGRTGFGLELVYSPGGWSEQNGDDAFAASRPGADSEYFYGKLNLDRVQRLPGDFSLIARGAYQFSDGNLLASEALGLGGYNTVRGYEEREVLGDNGFLFSAELRTPEISIGDKIGRPGLNDSLQFLAFWDYGHAGIEDPLPGEDSSTDLSSLGVGLRYQIGANLSVRADYGWQLEDSGFGDGDDGRAHIGVTIGF